MKRPVLAFALLSAAYPAAQAQISFATAKTVSVNAGASIKDIAAGDFDDDGDLDVVTADRTVVTFTILTNDGTGQLSVHQAVTSSGSPEGILFADVNLDGYADVQSGEFNDGHVANFLNNTSGGVSHEGDYSLFRPMNLTAGHINGDLYPDMAAAGQGGLAVWSNDQDGSFTSVFSDGGYEAHGVAIADLDQDGDQDVVSVKYCCSGNEEMRVFINQGNLQAGTLGTFPGSPTVYTLQTGTTGSHANCAAGLLNNDAFPDIAITNRDNDTIEIWLNDGDGTFTAGTPVSVNADPWDVVIGDVDAIGGLDIVAGHSTSSNNLTILPGNNDGTFGAATVLSVGNAPGTVLLGNFDSTYGQDIVAAGQLDHTVYMLSNTTASLPVELDVYGVE